MLNFIISPSKVITVVASSKTYRADPSHPNYEKILEALKSGESMENIETLMDIQTGINNSLKKIGSGKAEIVNGEVHYAGEPLHSTIAERILHMLEDGFDVSHMMLFLDNLMDNPSKQSVDELFDFLANTGLPITEDGCFLAYKGLRRDFTDIHSGTFDNSPGATVSIRRNKVDDNRNRTCSYGLHVGAFEYASSFAGGGPVVLCKVNPKDVVSVPLDCGAQKCRTCSYEVLEVYQDSNALSKALYTADGAEAPTQAAKIENAEMSDVDRSIDYYLNTYTKDELVAFVVEIKMEESEEDYESQDSWDEVEEELREELYEQSMISLATTIAKYDCGIA